MIVTSYFFPDLGYHEGSYNRQVNDATVSVLERAGIEEAVCVLDVGCGSGQTLRRVKDLATSAELVGIDADVEALRAGKDKEDSFLLIRGTGERLPLADGVASHVICRVALNYMYQDQAIHEMIRVLGSGGRLILSYIAFGYAVQQFLSPQKPGIRQRLGNLKDLIAGLLLQHLGLQARRERFWGHSVPYTSMSRLENQLRDLGCKVDWRGHESTFLGLPTITWFVVSKDGGTCGCAD